MIDGENRMPEEPVPFGSSRSFCPPFRDRFLGSSGEYVREADLIKKRGGRLVSLWGFGQGRQSLLYTAFSDAEGLLILRTPVSTDPPSFPSIAFLFPLASRLERTVRDLFGWEPEGLLDRRPWIDHGQWPSPPFSGRSEGKGNPQANPVSEDYPFVVVEGEGVHEIPVGPVHAGIIEPGHFRFQVVGEKVLRMEERLGYAHRGIRALLRNLSTQEGARLASRVSGDTAVAYQIAYAQAVEIAAGTVPPDRALWIRSILLERERIANHLGDLGALGNDAGFGFGFVQFARLKEDFLRTNERIFGHRYLMDTIIPGGTSREMSLEDAGTMRREVQKFKKDVLELKTIYDEHGGLQDRFSGTGRLDPMLAGRWGIGGVVGRASGQMYDLRHDHPVMPWDQERIPVAMSRRGDVYARVHVRFQEIRHSLTFLESVLGILPQGPSLLPLEAFATEREGVGWVEGFRGEVLSWVRLGPDLRMLDVHFHDPSWFLWPALEMVVPDNLVADFPLINKSFNASYSGHDL
ncbi:MAG: hydrogenase large subunit [Leptospirales bacterium]